MKKIIAFLMSLLLILSSAFANAFAIRQWSVNNPMAVGASILYDGLKGAVTSSVLITPNATQVAKVLGTGGAGIALSYAVEQLLGAVDWVLDPANNQIRYKEIKPLNPTDLQMVYCNYLDVGHPTCVSANTEANALMIARKYGWFDQGYVYCPEENLNNSYYQFRKNSCTWMNQGVAINFVYIQNPFYDPQIPEKTLPLETVAQQVIENAKNYNLDAQFAVLAAATNILSEAENDEAKAEPIENELEKNAKNPPCITVSGKVVAVGTYGYRHDKVPPSKPHYPFTGDHYNLYRANQNPNNGKCFWVESGAADASNGQLPPPNSIPIEPFI